MSVMRSVLPNNQRKRNRMYIEKERERADVVIIKI